MTARRPDWVAGARIPFRPRRRSPAFTLVEIMVAIAILAMVVAAIYSTWTAILRASKVGLDAAAAAQRERVALRIMQDALASARLFSANWRWYYFAAENGDEATLSFVSHLPQWFPRAGKFGDYAVRRVTFSLEDGPDSQRQLVLRQAPLLMDFDQDEQEHPLVLVTNVKKLGFEFWDERRNDWFDDWQNTNTIPRLVRITLDLGSSSAYRSSWSRPPDEEVIRVVSVAATGVQQSWQMPNMPPGGMPMIPGQMPPGMVPGPGAPNPAGGQGVSK